MSPFIDAPQNLEMARRLLRRQHDGPASTDLSPAAQNGSGRAFVIRYANQDRADDCVAFQTVNTLRSRLGRAELTEDQTGLEPLGMPADSIVLPQYVPGLVNLLSGYDLIPPWNLAIRSIRPRMAMPEPKAMVPSLPPVPPRNGELYM